MWSHSVCRKGNPDQLLNPHGVNNCIFQDRLIWFIISGTMKDFKMFDIDDEESDSFPLSQIEDSHSSQEE